MKYINVFQQTMEYNGHRLFLSGNPVVEKYENGFKLVLRYS